MWPVLQVAENQRRMVRVVLCKSSRTKTQLVFRTCTLHGRILSLKQDSSHLHYKVMWPDHHDSSKNSSHEGLDGSDGADDGTAELLRRYFSLHLNLGTLYRQWSEADSNFQRKAPQFTGVRILSQDAWEALVCFICSSNNNISRISQMVSRQ